MLSAAIVTNENIADLRAHFDMDEKIFGRPAPHLECGQYLVEGYVYAEDRGMVIRFLDVMNEAGFARRYTFDAYNDSPYFNRISKIAR